MPAQHSVHPTVVKLFADEIAAQLGFTTTQSFHRAFRRWTGATVAAHRARLRAS